MANYGAMTAFRKALRAPEDKFDFGTVFRCEEDGRIIVKLEHEEWAEVTIDRSDGNAQGATVDLLTMQDVVEAIRGSDSSWEVSHNWKPAAPKD